ncbi:MAG: SRPBCC family protein [Acidimicrobiales bacterium]
MGTTRTLLGGAGAIGLAGTAAGGLYVLVVRGSVAPDLGVGRRLRPLGPIRRQIDAEAEVVFDVIAAPYLGQTPRAMEDKLKVRERGSDMVLADHYTPAGLGLTATTTETVRFERPRLVTFELVRGPVPVVHETFELTPHGDGTTTFVYEGELGTDLWGFGALWGRKVAGAWERAVLGSVDAIASESERRAGKGQR